MKHLVLAIGAVLAVAASAAAQIPPPAGQAAPPATQAAPAPPAGQAADVTGKWDVTVVTQQGATIPSVLVLKKDGDKLLGTISSQEYGENAVEAEVKDKDVALYFTIQIQNNPLAIAFYGTAQGDTMKGTADLGQMGTLEWSAKRAAAPTASPATQDAPTPAATAKTDLTGTWNLQVNTEAGSGAPTVTFKQDGEKLTGQYSGQLGEAAFTGTLKGSDLRFEFDLSAGGNTVHIVYAGTVDKDTMKGSVKFGDLGEGTFTGARKKM